jgi:hypothetical protein
MSPARIRTSGGWQSVKSIFAKTGASTWKSLKNAYIKINDGVARWVSIFAAGPEIQSQVTLSQSTNSTTKLITLTGTNYHWSDALTLQYKFKRSADGGSSWATISSGTATNPSVGSSNEYPYELADNKSDVVPNVDNLYIFEVTATSEDDVVAVSTSETQTVSAARNISNLSVVTADTTYNSVKLQFTAGAYSSSYFVRYTYSGIQEGYFRSAGSGSPTTITVTDLSPSTSYSFYVTPYTGGIVSGSNKGYGGNESSPVSATTNAVPIPVKVSSPTLSGTGAAQTSITATSGSYQSGTFGFVTTKIVYYQSPYTLPVDGETSSSATIQDTATPAPTYTIGQTDATTPNKKYYARDAVTNVAGTQTYYYYSSLVSAFIPTITDTFNRTVSPGLGTTSSGYVYSSVVEQERSTWSTNGSTASSSGTILRYVNPLDPGSFAASYPLEAIELTGKTNLTASVEIPSGGGGPGIAFWVSGAGSFWAIAPAYSKTSSTSSVTTYTCDGTVISTNATGTDPNCHGCTVTSATSGGASSDCNGSAIATNASGTGCYGCTVTTVAGSTTYTCGSGDTYNYSSAIVAQAACRGCSYSDTSYVDKTCTGGPAEYADGNLSTACGGKCSCTGPFTRTTYGCTGSASWSGTLTACNAEANFSVTAANVGKKCGSCTRNPITTQITYPTVASTGSETYYVCNTNVCTNVTQFSCTYATNTSADSYTCTGRDTSTPVVTTYSCKPKGTTSNVTTSIYNTNLRIMSTVGSYVQVLKDENINSNNSAFSKAFKISVTTSGDVITGTAYSDLSGTVIGTATYTRTSNNLAKSSANGSSYAGIIKTPSAINSSSIDNNAGSTFDNLSIS